MHALLPIGAAIVGCLVTLIILTKFGEHISPQASVVWRWVASHIAFMAICLGAYALASSVMPQVGNMYVEAERYSE